MFLPSGPANDARSARRGKPNKNQLLHTLQPSLHLTATSTNNLGSGGGGGGGGRQTQRPPPPAQLFSAYSGTASVQGGGPIRAAAADPHRIGRRPNGGGGGGLRLLPSFVGSLVATATPASVEPASTRHVSSGVSVAASRRRPPGNNNVEIITGKPGGLLPPPATPRTFTLNLPFKKQIGRYPDPYLSTLPSSLSAASSSALQELPPKQPKPNPLKQQQQHSTTNPKPHSAADYYYDDDDDDYYYDDSDQDQLSPPQILQIVNTVQSALDKPPERRTRLPFSSNPSNSFQIPRQPKQQSQQQQAFLTTNSLNRFSGRQVAVKGFPNGLPDATPEGVVIALLNAQNSNISHTLLEPFFYRLPANL